MRASRFLWFVLALGACARRADPPADAPDSGITTFADEPEIVIHEWFDVIVVGAGPAGTAAALAAQELGASVLVLDRDDEPGKGLITGGQAFAVGSRWQRAQGLMDSIEIAQVDWARITAADPETPGVYEFLAGSAATLEWLERYGLSVSGVRSDLDSGPMPRIHQLDWSQIGDGRGLHAAIDGELRANVEVNAPILEDGAVVGVVWTDLLTGEVGASGAGAVVVATGGFLRNRAEVDRVMPEVVGRPLVYEAHYHSDGGGLPFLDAVGAGRLAPGQIGIYVHSMRDPGLTDGESLLVIGAESGILADATGARFANEELQRSFDLFDALPPGDVYAVVAGDTIDALEFRRPGYNWAVSDEPESLPLDELAALTDDVILADSPEDLALAAGVDVDGLLATIDDFNQMAGTTIDDFGRDLRGAAPVEGDRWAAIRLTPGLAKNFGGVATDPEGHVLDAAGAPIPGLFAAGEVAGMVIGGGGGDGFSGSVSACYWGGRVAGGEAARFAGADAP